MLASLAWAALWAMTFHYSFIAAARAYHNVSVSTANVAIPAMGWAAIIVFWFN